MNQQLPQTASEAILKRRDALVEDAVKRQYARYGDRWEPYGQPGYQKSLRDMGYHFAYLAEALAASDPALFEDYVAWAKVLFANLGFAEEVIDNCLEAMAEATAAQLPPELQAVVARYLAAGQQHLTAAPSQPRSWLADEQPLTGLARQYLRYLLRGARRQASKLILDAVAEGTAIKDIYQHVFQRTQREVGRLWQTNQISVAQEHYCTAATQLVMSQLYPYIFATEKIGRRFLGTCVGGELHEIGVRMVADFFEMAGWDTYYLGANTPPESVVAMAVEEDIDVVGISATMTFHVPQVRALIHHLRQADAGKQPYILVGGYPFNVSPQLWQEVGGDGYAPDAETAVKVANRLVG